MNGRRAPPRAARLALAPQFILQIMPWRFKLMMLEGNDAERCFLPADNPFRQQPNARMIANQIKTLDQRVYHHLLCTVFCCFKLLRLHDHHV
jgi:hypothetical protein